MKFSIKDFFIFCAVCLISSKIIGASSIVGKHQQIPTVLMIITSLDYNNIQSLRENSS